MSKIYVIGIGPGGIGDMTARAKDAILDSDTIIGYSKYIELIKPYFSQKVFISSTMKKEVDRCRIALDKALEGSKIAVISSGDSGIYGMAGVMLEVINESGQDMEVEVIPGVTASTAAAAILGAPIMHDHAVISLSDLLTPWELISRRIELAAQGNFVICIYNPKSLKRSVQIEKAVEILLKYRENKTPVGIVRNAGRNEETHVFTTLGNLLTCEIDMFTVIIIGNSNTYVKNSRMITPRGYRY